MNMYAHHVRTLHALCMHLSYGCGCKRTYTRAFGGRLQQCRVVWKAHLLQVLVKSHVRHGCEVDLTWLVGIKLNEGEFYLKRIIDPTDLQ